MVKLVRSTGLYSTLMMAALRLGCSQAAPSPPGEHRTPPAPVNLQVLPKTTSAADVISVMRGFEGQLGVECSYCHTQDPATHRLNFASDANPQKATARVMMRMTADLNAKYVSTIPDYSGQMVSCGTCHRGKAKPETFVPAPDDHAPTPKHS